MQRQTRIHLASAAWVVALGAFAGAAANFSSAPNGVLRADIQGGSAGNQLLSAARLGSGRDLCKRQVRDKASSLLVVEQALLRVTGALFLIKPVLQLCEACKFAPRRCLTRLVLLFHGNV